MQTNKKSIFLKQTFYKLHKAEQDAARKAFIDEGGNADDFVPAPDPWETRFKEIMSSIKEKRSVMAAELEQEKEENLQKKLAILDKMKALIETTEDTSKIYNEFKQLQQEWNDIKPSTRRQGERTMEIIPTLYRKVLRHGEAE